MLHVLLVTLSAGGLSVAPQKPLCLPHNQLFNIGCLLFYFNKTSDFVYFDQALIGIAFVDMQIEQVAHDLGSEDYNIGFEQSKQHGYAFNHLEVYAGARFP